MRLLITDLDNTLYDWVTYFAHAFDAMVEELSRVLDVEREQLLSEFKAVHQKHHNIEQPFALFEIASVQEQFSDLSREELFQTLDAPLSAFREAREEKLCLYPGVEETLNALRRAEVLVVGHTEALAVQAASRLRRLGIIDAFHHLYAIDHGDMPPHPRRDHHSRRSGGGQRDHLITYLPDEDRKPNPDLLHDICEKEDVALSDAVYVGDSLAKDVGMAKAAGIPGVWARYGRDYDDALWNLLVQITHWTEEDVRREERIREAYGDVNPDATIDAFSEILEVGPTLTRRAREAA